MIKRLLVIIAIVCIMGTMLWMNFNPLYTLPVTLLGMVVVISPLAVLSFALLALGMTLFVSMFMRMC